MVSLGNLFQNFRVFRRVGSNGIAEGKDLQVEDGVELSRLPNTNL
jgi:hypothetical protein